METLQLAVVKSRWVTFPNISIVKLKRGYKKSVCKTLGRVWWGLDDNSSKEAARITHYLLLKIIKKICILKKRIVLCSFCTSSHI